MSEPTTADPGPLLNIFVNGLGQFTGAFFGVLAGTAVTIAVHYWFKRHEEKQQVENFRFEIGLNKKKLESWLEELGKYRNAVNGDALLQYFGYFKTSSGVGVIAFQMHQSGVIYRYLSHEHIGQIQEIFNDFSLNAENYINNQIAQRKNALATIQQQNQHHLWQQILKPQVVSDIDFWEKRFKSHIASLQSVLVSLSNAG